MFLKFHFFAFIRKKSKNCTILNFPPKSNKTNESDWSSRDSIRQSKPFTGSCFFLVKMFGRVMSCLCYISYFFMFFLYECEVYFRWIKENEWVLSGFVILLKKMQAEWLISRGFDSNSWDKHFVRFS